MSNKYLALFSICSLRYLQSSTYIKEKLRLQSKKNKRTKNLKSISRIFLRLDFCLNENKKYFILHIYISIQEV